MPLLPSVKNEIMRELELKRPQTENSTQKGSFLSRTFSAVKSGVQAFGQWSLTNKVAVAAYVGATVASPALGFGGVAAAFAGTGTVASVANLIQGNKQAAVGHAIFPLVVSQLGVLGLLYQGQKAPEDANTCPVVQYNLNSDLQCLSQRNEVYLAKQLRQKTPVMPEYKKMTVYPATNRLLFNHPERIVADKNTQDPTHNGHLPAAHFSQQRAEEFDVESMIDAAVEKGFKEMPILFRRDVRTASVPEISVEERLTVDIGSLNATETLSQQVAGERTKGVDLSSEKEGLPKALKLGKKRAFDALKSIHEFFDVKKSPRHKKRK